MSDPGWRPDFRVAWFLLLPFGPKHRASNGVPALVWMRSLVIFSPVIWAMIVFVITSLGLAGLGAPEFLIIVIGPGLLAVAAVERLRRRALSRAPSEDPIELAATYRASFFGEWAMSMSPVQFGFLTVFLAHALWPILLALPFAAVALLRSAPTKRRIGEEQRRLDMAGSGLDLIQVLMVPWGDIPLRRPRRR